MIGQYCAKQCAVISLRSSADVFSAAVACICLREGDAVLKKSSLVSWSGVGSGVVLTFDLVVGSGLRVEAVLVSDVP
eukprot:10153308-Ditylum_brightwellii.AAC.1